MILRTLTSADFHLSCSLDIFSFPLAEETQHLIQLFFMWTNLNLEYIKISLHYSSFPKSLISYCLSFSHSVKETRSFAVFLAFHPAQFIQWIFTQWWFYILYFTVLSFWSNGFGHGWWGSVKFFYSGFATSLCTLQLSLLASYLSCSGLTILVRLPKEVYSTDLV